MLGLAHHLDLNTASAWYWLLKALLMSEIHRFFFLIFSQWESAYQEAYLKLVRNWPFNTNLGASSFLPCWFCWTTCAVENWCRETELILKLHEVHEPECSQEAIFYQLQWWDLELSLTPHLCYSTFSSQVKYTFQSNEIQILGKEINKNQPHGRTCTYMFLNTGFLW